MSSKKENKKLSSSKVITSKVRSYANEPYFVKKAEAAKHVIEQYGLPEELKSKK